ncbi:MAG: agmatinase [Oscillospiraceae bacterium]|nr:agmatinase [Oscillospiraceae bacterium]
MNRQYNNFIGCEAEYDEADIVFFGAPYDGTTSNKPGARFAGRAVRAESVGIETYSPYLQRDLEDIKVFDGGELELPFGAPEPVLDLIYSYTKKIISDDKIPVMLGGEHLVTLGAVRALAEKYPDLVIVHFDAHTDLRDEYLGQKLSHACVMRRCHDLVGDSRIISYGVRSGTREEFEWAKEHIYLQKEVAEDEFMDLMSAPVYITIDLDVLDPSVFPGTGTPEAGGLDYKELLDSVAAVCAISKVVGCDLVELSPPYDPSGISTALTCKLLRELFLCLNGGVSDDESA